MLPVVREAIVERDHRRQNLQLIRRRIELRNQSTPFDIPDDRFIELFRLNKMLTRNLIEDLRPLVNDPVTRKSVTIETKVLCALRYLATGSYQRSIGQDNILGLSQTSVHRCVKEITQAISVLANNRIQMPTTRQERNEIKLQFMNKWGFPGTIGAIDCFHVAMLKPHNEEHNYMNRKGYHSINVQVICDHELLIRNIWANFGGSTHDSYIWRMSQVQRYMQRLNERSWLIGDSGYPLQRYLMTPFRTPENVAETTYNNVLCSARNVVERCIGLLKQRFRCLLNERVARYEPQFVSTIIRACAYLHNLCIQGNIDFVFNFENNDVDEDHNRNHYPNNGNLREGINIRNNIV